MVKLSRGLEETRATIREAKTFLRYLPPMLIF